MLLVFESTAPRKTARPIAVRANGRSRATGQGSARTGNVHKMCASAARAQRKRGNFKLGAHWRRPSTASDLVVRVSQSSLVETYQAFRVFNYYYVLLQFLRLESVG